MAHKPIFSVAITRVPGTIDDIPNIIDSVTKISLNGQAAYLKLGLGKKSPTPKGRTAKSTSTNYKLCIKKLHTQLHQFKEEGTVKLYISNSMRWRIAVRQ